MNETVAPTAVKKFGDYQYQRPDIEKISKEFDAALQRFENAQTFEEQVHSMNEIAQIRLDFGTMEEIAGIRYSINTNDSFYEGENTFFDENRPLFQELVFRYYQALGKARFRPELEKTYGTLLFEKCDAMLKTFHPDLIPLFQEENKLKTEYTNLISQASVQFRGEEKNLSELGPYETSADRATRKEAVETKYGFYAENSARIDEIYDKLVHLRTRIARQLGFNNYVELGYLRMQRLDYNREMVAFYREQILQHVVPLVVKLQEQHRKRLGVETYKFYDQNLLFASGNPQPKGTPQWIMDHGKAMYNELSPETAEFFQFMTESELLDLETKKGKAPGGYCTFIGGHKAPFIFSNFNGTSGDIDVLTHEAGHAFQAYRSKDFEVEEYHWPSYEACEIHSMSMEYLTWPWMERFFKEDADKYRIGHIINSLYFLPYGVAIDEFQHLVYENPDWTPAERNNAWKSVEGKYLPGRNYDGIAYLENGGFWQRQTHVFHTPFYYIDYTLAEICALQFWTKSLENREQAWKDYLRLCDAGGSMKFLELVKLAGLQSPFKPGVVAEVVSFASRWLEENKPDFA